MGDGTGGALALSYVQQLVENDKPLPYKICLISPMLDATMTNPQITEYLVEKDRFVNIQGLQNIMNVWSDKEPLSNSFNFADIWNKTRIATNYNVWWW